MYIETVEADYITLIATTYRILSSTHPTVQYHSIRNKPWPPQRELLFLASKDSM
jgi:hypothetical protein